ncbi:MAG: UDP-N-acetylglucosamine 2-epimerase (non-hydrolyzing) [Pseudomonadota bacterium]
MLKTLSQQKLNAEVAVVMGTRPGIIKFAPIIKELERRGVPFHIIHSGQHYSYNMDRMFFEELRLPEPRFAIQGVSEKPTHGGQTAVMLEGIEAALLEARPRVVMVDGDANTNLAGGLAGRKLGLVVVHLEAGNRSRDWSMPEEHNRVILDHICDVLYAPTQPAVDNLRHENVNGEILLTGNTIVDSVLYARGLSETGPSVMERLNLTKGRFALFTSHREENVDVPSRLAHVPTMLGQIVEAGGPGFQVVFPMHPRTRLRLTEAGMLDQVKAIEGVQAIEPLGYVDLIRLTGDAAWVFTDSGGIQEEACILQTPCVTLRDNTERPETVSVGANIVAGYGENTVRLALDFWKTAPRGWDNPLGDGKASQRVVDNLESLLKAS